MVSRIGPKPNVVKTRETGESSSVSSAPPQATPELTDPSQAAHIVGSADATLSSVEHKKQAGAAAKIDLRSWEPDEFTATALEDIKNTFETLKTMPPAITFFGGARIKEDDPFYERAKDIGRWLAVLGIPVRTGAGPGVMAAAAEGYQEAMNDLSSVPDDVRQQIDGMRDQFHTLIDGFSPEALPDDKRTQGFNIALPYEQGVPDAIEHHEQIALFPYRKVALYENARGLITFPGGYGTLDELFEVWKLGARGAHNDPMLAYGEDFWRPLLDAVREVAVMDRNLVDPAAFARMRATDDTVEVVKQLGEAANVKGFERDPEQLAASMAAEIQDAVKILDDLPRAVTFIGGARLQRGDPALGVARQVSEAVTAGGAPTRIGGDSTLASAVVEGALAADPSAEVQAFLLKGEKNHDLNLRTKLEVENFVTHKELIGRKTKAFVALPGGLGTLDEVFTVLTQLQCGKLPPDTPVVLVGESYWKPIMQAVKDQMLNGERKTISPEDLDLFVITDDPQLVSDVALGHKSLHDAKADPRAAGIRADD
jgi:uncharacterized protein (TIGR00730 family)